jgi:hypothetical protein
MRKLISLFSNKLTLLMILALIVAGGASAQSVGDTIHYSGKTWRVQSISGSTLTLQEVVATTNRSLNGIWDRGDGNTISIIDSNGYFTIIDSDWQKVQNNGDIKIGRGKFRNIKSTGNLKWSAQELTHDTSTYRIRNWSNCTITMASDGNTFTSYNSTTTNKSRVYTRRR